MIDASQKLALRNILVPLVAAVVERLVDSIPANTADSAPSAQPRLRRPRATKGAVRIGKPPLSQYKINRIRQARGRGMTIKQAAAFAKVSTSSVQRYSKPAA